MYASGHPCPMCLAAMYMTGVSAVFYAYSNEVAESYGLSTAGVYAELRKPIESQSLPIRCLPVRLSPSGDREARPGEDLYDAWRKRTARVTTR